MRIGTAVPSDVELQSAPHHFIQNKSIFESYTVGDFEQEAIAKLNPTIPYDAQEEALRKVLRSDSPELFQNNYQFHKYLTEGVDVEYRKTDRIAGDKVWIIDY